MARMDHHVFAIWGPPCSGKTTFAVNMATVLATSNYMTCLISASDHGELQSFFGTTIPKNKGLYSAITSGRHVRESLVEAMPNLFLLEADTSGDAYDLAEIRAEQVKNMIADLREQFPYVIIDCTSFKESVITGMGLGGPVSADKVVICLPHRVSASMWVTANRRMIEAIAQKVLYVDVDTRAGGCSMEQLLTSIGLAEPQIKFGCVDVAYECENTSHPIVMKGGRAERKYKKALLDLLKILLDIEGAEKKTKEKVKQGQRVSLNHKMSAEERFNKASGINYQGTSQRAARKAEEDAIRQQQADADAEYDSQM